LVNKQSDIQGDKEASMPQNLFTCETFTCKIITNANGMCVLLGAFTWCLTIPHFQLWSMWVAARLLFLHLFVAKWMPKCNTHRLVWTILVTGMTPQTPLKLLDIEANRSHFIFAIFIFPTIPIPLNYEASG